MTDDSFAAPSPPPGIDQAAVTETYVDGLSGVHVRNGVAKLNFYATRHRAGGRDEAMGVATLVITLADFAAMTAGLNQMMRQLQEQGILPAPADQHATHGQTEAEPRYD